MILSAASPNQQNLEYWYTNIVGDKELMLNQRYCLGNVDPLTGVMVHSMNFVDLNFDGLIDMISVVSPSNYSDE
jgi:hypothetical protein